MRFDKRRERTEELRRLPLTTVLRAWGAQQDPADKCKWHTSQGTLSVTGAKFINWHSGTSGGGAIDLIIHLEDCRFIQALDWLQHHLPAGQLGHKTETQDSDLVRPSATAQSASLIMPAARPDRLRRVRSYLQSERGIPPLMIESLIEVGKLYADAQANAVFVLLGKEGEVIGAELRSSHSTWRGMVPGTRKDVSGLRSALRNVRSLVRQLRPRWSRI